MPDQASKRSVRLAYLVSHPIQYQAPLLRRLSGTPGVLLHVFFQSDISVRAYRDEGFGQEIKWDVPLLDGYSHTFLPARFGSPHSLSGRLPFSRGLGAALKAGGFDALWVHGYARPYNLAALVRARALGLSLLLRDETHEAGNPRRGPTEFFKRLYVRALVGLGVRFLAVGSLNAAYWRKLGAPAERIFHTPYAVDNADFQARIDTAAAEREARRTALGLLDDAPVILFAGKFLPRKRPQDLLAAYRHASDRLSAQGHPLPWLVFAGAGETLEAVRAQAADLPRVRFPGFQTQAELAGLFDLCDLFVIPSAHEQWGLIVNEVMNAAKPVLVSDQCGCAPDLVRSGVNGWRFPTGDVERLASHLVALCSDQELRERMGAASLEIISGWSYEADVTGVLAALGASSGHVAARPAT